MKFIANDTISAQRSFAPARVQQYTTELPRWSGSVGSARAGWGGKEERP